MMIKNNSVSSEFPATPIPMPKEVQEQIINIGFVLRFHKHSEKRVIMETVFHHKLLSSNINIKLFSWHEIITIGFLHHAFN